MTPKLTRRRLVVLATGIAMFASALAGTPKDEGKWVVNVNDANFDQLITIPGIGDALAGEIFRERPYHKIEDLLRVDGINKRKLEAIRPYVKVKGPTEPYKEKKK